MDRGIESILDQGLLVARALERGLSKLHLGVTQYRLLLALGQADDLQPGELAVLLFQEPHSVSGMLNRLEDIGAIERFRDKKDRRVVHVRLTLEGRRLLRSAVSEADTAMMQIRPALDIWLHAHEEDTLIRLAGHEPDFRRATRRKLRGAAAP